MFGANSFATPIFGSGCCCAAVVGVEYHPIPSIKRGQPIYPHRRRRHPLDDLADEMMDEEAIAAILTLL